MKYELGPDCRVGCVHVPLIDDLVESGRLYEQEILGNPSNELLQEGSVTCPGLRVRRICNFVLARQCQAIVTDTLRVVFTDEEPGI